MFIRTLSLLVVIVLGHALPGVAPGQVRPDWPGVRPPAFTLPTDPAEVAGLQLPFAPTGGTTPLAAGKHASLFLKSVHIAGSGNLSRIDSASDVAVSGDVIVTVGAGEMPGTSFDWWVAAYSHTGTPLWTHRHDGTAEAYDLALLVRAVTDGFVVAGITSDPATQLDLLVVKYGLDGTVRWQTRYDGPHRGYDVPNAMAVDGQGNTYITGYSHRTPGLGNNIAMLTLKLDASGVIEWVMREDAEIGEGLGIAVSPAGTVAVTGTQVSHDPATAISRHNFATLVYDGEGGVRWKDLRSVASRNEAVGHAVGFLPDGGVVATGKAFVAPGAFDTRTYAFDAQGQLRWTDRYGGATGLDDVPVGLLIDDAGVTICGYTQAAAEGWWTRRLDPAGSLVWSLPTTNARRLVACRPHDAQSFLMVGNVAEPDPTWNTVVSLVSANDGSEIWSRTIDRGDDDQAYGVAAVDGDVLVAGRTWAEDTDYDLHIYRLSETGSTRWERTLGGRGESNDFAMAATFGLDGSTYVTAQSWLDWQSDLMTTRFAPSGVEAWTALSRPRAGNEPRDVAVDAQGRVLTAGSTHISQGSESWAVPVLSMADAQGNESWVTVHDPGFAGRLDDVEWGPDGPVASGPPLNLFAFDEQGAVRWYWQHPDAVWGGWERVLVRSQPDGTHYLIGALSTMPGVAPAGDPVIVGVDRTGQAVWSRRIDLGAFFVQPAAAQIGPSGELAVAYTHVLPGGRRTWWFAVIERDGSIRWQDGFRSEQGEIDVPSDLVVLPDGSLLIAGGTLDELSGSDLRQHVVLKYGADGVRLWEYRSGTLYKAAGPDGNFRHGPRIAPTAHGGVYLAGQLMNQQPHLIDLVLLKLAPDGRLESGVSYDSPNGYYDFATGISVDPVDPSTIRLAAFRGYRQPLGDWIRGVVSTLVFEDVGVALATEVGLPQQPEIEIWPQPAHGEAFLRFRPVPAERMLSVFDALGRRIHHERIASYQDTITLGVQGLPAGLYLVTLGESRRTLVVL
ncbi:MAG: hypothetical protein JJ896_15055 [Rhodothermales bacterium]|nr:hypothetical protein [Rhodothermales bacterium]